MFLPFMVGGGLLGALMNKKDPLKGALLGGALGAATGGAGLFGGAPATGGLGLTSGTSAGLASMGGGTGLTMGVAPGMASMGGGAGLTAGPGALTASQAASPSLASLFGGSGFENAQKAMQVASMLTPERPQQAQAVAPPQMSPAGTQSLVQLYEQGKNNAGAQSIAQREQERMQRKSTMWG